MCMNMIYILLLVYYCIVFSTYRLIYNLCCAVICVHIHVHIYTYMIWSQSLNYHPSDFWVSSEEFATQWAWIEPCSSTKKSQRHILPRWMRHDTRWKQIQSTRRWLKYPIGSVCMPCMVCHLPSISIYTYIYIYTIHGSYGYVEIMEKNETCWSISRFTYLYIWRFPKNGGYPGPLSSI